MKYLIIKVAYWGTEDEERIVIGFCDSEDIVTAGQQLLGQTKFPEIGQRVLEFYERKYAEVFEVEVVSKHVGMVAKQ